MERIGIELARHMSVDRCPSHRESQGGGERERRASVAAAGARRSIAALAAMCDAISIDHHTTSSRAHGRLAGVPQSTRREHAVPAVRARGQPGPRREHATRASGPRHCSSARAGGVRPHVGRRRHTLPPCNCKRLRRRAGSHAHHARQHGPRRPHTRRGGPARVRPVASR